MENKKDKLENFKIAISSTVRSLTNSNKIEVSFGNQETKSNKYSIKLPNLQNISNEINYEEIRAIADSKSLNHRFSNLKTLKKHEPEGSISKKLYNISEKIRCEKIGTSYFKGVKKNIEKYYQKRIASLDFKNSEDRITESFENFLRVKFLDFKNQFKIDKKLNSFKKDLNTHFDNKIDDLKNSTLNQEKFNSLVSRLIAKMDLDSNLEEEQTREDENQKEDKKTNTDNQDQKTRSKEEKNEEMSIDAGIPDLENHAKESDKGEDGLEIEDSSRPDLRKKGSLKLTDLKYKTYTEEFDEIIKAEELENP